MVRYWSHHVSDLRRYWVLRRGTSGPSPRADSGALCQLFVPHPIPSFCNARTKIQLQIGQKDANGYLPWVAFEPQHWSGHSPWKYYATTTTFWDWTPHGDPTNQEQAASDYVVLILDVPGGDTGLGYLGARGYVKDWDNLAVFKHVGYPGQLDPNDDTPYSEPYFSINNAFSPENFCIHQHGLALRKSFSFAMILCSLQIG